MAILEELNALEKFLIPDRREEKSFHIVLIGLCSFNSFGIHTLNSLLRNHGFKVSCVFFKDYFTNAMSQPTQQEFDLAVGIIRQINPDLVGIGTTSTFAPIAIELIEKIRPLDAPIIMGGAHAIFNPEHCIQYADFVCVGEGEFPLLTLAQALSSRGDYKNIKNLWVRDGSAIIKNGLYPLLQNLDVLTYPDFRDEDKYYIGNDKLYHGEPYYTEKLAWYNFMASRGCPFSCSYCGNSYLCKQWKGLGPMLRRRSVAHVIGELKRAKTLFPKLSWISANDEIFVLDKKWLADFCDRYKDEIDVPFHCDIHPARVTEEVISQLTKSGMKTITMGVQSGSEKIRREVYHRNTPDEMIIRSAHILKKYNIFPNYDFIFDNPLENIVDTEESFNLLLRLPRPFSTNTYSLQHHPNTDLTLRLLAENRITKNDIDGVSLKGLKNWHITLNIHKENTDLYYMYAIFKIFSSQVTLVTPYANWRILVFPTYLLKFLIARKRFLKKHVFILRILCTFGEFAQISSRRISVLLAGNFRQLIHRIFISSPRSANRIHRFRAGPLTK